MRYLACEKLEIIQLVEQSHLPLRRTLVKLGIPRATFYRWYLSHRRARSPGRSIAPAGSCLEPDPRHGARADHQACARQADAFAARVDLVPSPMGPESIQNPTFRPARQEPQIHIRSHVRSGLLAARSGRAQACVAGAGSARRCCDRRHPRARVSPVAGAPG
jgi:hypothetical protein